MSTSTIQIKRGTGSAVPSGLTDGELAINLDSGRLYYGSGSNSVDSYTFTNVTASGDISASGTLDVTGNVNFDGDLDVDGTANFDTVDIDGDITIADAKTIIGESRLVINAARLTFQASGDGADAVNIASGSTTIAKFAGVADLATGADHTRIVLGSANILGQTSTVKVDGTLETTSHISASGDITASGGLTLGDGQIVGFSGAGRGTIGSNRTSIRGGETLSGNIRFLSGSTAIGTMDCGPNGGQIGLGSVLTPSPVVTITGDLTTTSHITASGNIRSSGTIITSTLSGGATGDQSGSLHLSGSLTFRANEPEPAVSASTLFVKQKSTDNAPDTDLRFSNSGLTPAFAWVTLDDAANTDSSEYGFGHDSAVTSNTHNMVVTHDSSGDGVKIFSQINGTYKVTGNYVVINGSTSADVIYDINVDGSTVHTFSARAHSSVDPVERTQIYVGTVNSGSFVRATVDGTNCALQAGSVLLVERLA